MERINKKIIIMKKIIMLIAFLSILVGTNAQKIVEETVENINTKQAIQIIEAAAKELNYSIDKFDSQKNVLITIFFEWSSIAITNHAKLKFEVKDNKVLITMIERQYKSDKGWTNSPTNLSKKNHKKYLGSFANKITSIANDEKLRKDAIYNSVLIKMFKPYVKVRGLEWKFIKGIKNASSYEGVNLSSQNYLIELTVTNTTSSKHNINMDIYTDNGYATMRQTMSFDEPNGTTHSIEIVPGETKKMFIYHDGKLIQSEKGEDIITKFSFNYLFNAIAGKRTAVVNYNMPIPFENKFE